MRFSTSILTTTVLTLLLVSVSPVLAQDIIFLTGGAADSALQQEVESVTGGSFTHRSIGGSLPTLDELDAADLVYVLPDGPIANASALGDVLADFVDERSGRVMLGFGCVNHLAGRIMSSGYSPVLSSGPGMVGYTSYDGTVATRTGLYDCVSDFSTYYRNDLTAFGGGRIDGRYEDGRVAHAYRPDMRVVYQNGVPQYGTEPGSGQWAEIFANALRIMKPRRALVADFGTLQNTFWHAAENLGFTTVVVTNEADFLSQVYLGQWDVVAVEAAFNLITPGVANALDTVIGLDVPVMLSYFDLDGSLGGAAAATLRETFGIGTAIDRIEPDQLYNWFPGNPLWSVPNMITSMPVATDSAFDNGDRLTVASGARMVSGATAYASVGQGRVIIANNGLSIVNSVLFDDYNPTQATDFAENQITYLTKRSIFRTLVINGGERELARRAIERRGSAATAVSTALEAEFELDTNDWQRIVVDAPDFAMTPNLFDHLVAHIVSGGELHVTCSEITSADGEGLVEALGLLAATLSTPAAPAYVWEPGANMFNSPHSIPSVIAPIGSATHPFGSVVLTPTASADALAGFTAGPSGSAATVVGSSGRTVINGFHYDDHDPCVMLELIENQLSGLGTTVVLTTPFMRGDCNADAAFDISDPLSLLSFLFSGASELSCSNACDANDDGSVEVSDVVASLSRLFVPGTAPLPAPFDSCGADPTVGSLSCVSSACP